MSLPDYYGVRAGTHQILGVRPDAAADVIKKAYQRESLRTHPDRFPSAGPEEKREHTREFQRAADACES